MTKHKKEVSASTPIKIHPSDLPLSCPRADVPVWSLHPKVYLPIDKTGEEVCPYCGAHYRLEE